jgi:hypothetical protein
MKTVRLIVLSFLLMSLIKALLFPLQVHAQVPEAAFTLYIPESLKAGVEVPPPPAPGGTLPAEIVGTWFTGVIPPVDYYDPATGEWADVAGLGEMYVFSADGNFTYSGFLRIQNGMCVSEVSTYRKGSAEKAAIGKLTLQPELAKTRTVINCGSRSESTTDGPFDAQTISYALADDEGGRLQLTLTVGDSSTSYYKEGMAESLVGTWQQGAVTSVNFYDADTKSFAPQDSEGGWYHFNADGTYTFGEFGYATDENGCELTGWIYQEGTVAVAGSKLTTTPVSGVSRVDSSCQPGAPVVKPYTEAVRSFAWLFRDRTTEKKLVLIPIEAFEEFVFVRE